MTEKSPAGQQRYCGQCGAALASNDKFCAACGAPAGIADYSASRAEGPKTQPQQSRGKALWLLAGLAIALVAVLAAMLLLNRSQQPASTTTSAPQAAPAQRADIPNPDVPRIDLGQAHASSRTGTAIFVDTRDQQSYAQSHVPDAISIPEDDLATRYQELPKDQQIITYCT